MSEDFTTPGLEATLRRSLEALDRRDFDAALTAYLPDAVWDTSVVGIGVFRGRDAIRGLFEDWWGTYTDLVQVLEEFRPLGNDVTLGVLTMRGRPEDSSGFVELRYAGVLTWAEELIERATIYTDIDVARAAAERLAEERG